ncbi:MAG: hypothetical protein U0N62_04125, partial [Hydrogeniiclostridium sp.]
MRENRNTSKKGYLLYSVACIRLFYDFIVRKKPAAEKRTLEPIPGEIPCKKRKMRIGIAIYAAIRTGIIRTNVNTFITAAVLPLAIIM